MPRILRNQARLLAQLAARTVPRVTRQRANRLAAIDAAATRIQEVPAEAAGPVEEMEEDEVEEMEAALPETPDDGVVPDSSFWDAAGRRALEAILKHLTQDEVRLLLL